jgi:dihydrofolate synthase / folylpolyglutamate synthase
VTGGGRAFPDQNLQVAVAAASELLGRDISSRKRTDGWTGYAPIPPRVPGRAEVVGQEPPQVFDAAHNPDGARALSQLLPGFVPGAPVICCLAVLEGKDAKGIVEGLAPAVAHFVCTQIPEAEMRGTGRPDARAIPAETLMALCRKAGSDAETVAEPVEAWERARELARERGGVALAAGSHYLLSSIWTERPAPSS